MIHYIHIESCRLMSSGSREASPLRQERQWFLLAISLAGRVLCVAVRALDFDA
jgi:hypothetical protein